jgi:formylglycine-generating enzyme required for sulfatase activity
MALLVTCGACGARFRARDRHRGRKAKCPKCSQSLVLEGATIPDNDVFISYSSLDKPAADAVCMALERQRLRCWMAPRDILPGAEWGGAIIDAIGNSRTMVLVYTTHSNESKQVLREIERAVNKGLPVVPLRIEDVALSKNMEYFISASHWLDALGGPSPEHLDRLVKTIMSLIDRHQDLEVNAPEAAPIVPRWKQKTFLIGSISAAVVMIAIVLTLSLMSGSKASDSGGAKHVSSSTQLATTAPAAKPIANSVGMQLVPIPAGEFMMGALDGDPNADRDERPRHKVILTKPFYMAARELSVQEYEAIKQSPAPLSRDQLELVKHNPDAKRERWPVESLLYVDALSVIKALNDLPAERLAHRTYRLPTEAEWEYACRAGTNSIFIGSDTLTASEANFLVNPKMNDAAHPVEVASYPPSPWGLYDMLGNAREWCSDWKGEYPGETQIDPQGPQTGRFRVTRGGGAHAFASGCRVSARPRVEPNLPKNAKLHAGLRVVCIIEP